MLTDARDAMLQIASDFFVRKAQDSIAGELPIHLRIAPSVVGGFVIAAINFDDEVLLRKVEVEDSVNALRALNALELVADSFGVQARFQPLFAWGWVFLKISCTLAKKCLDFLSGPHTIVITQQYSLGSALSQDASMPLQPTISLRYDPDPTLGRDRAF